MKSEATVYPIKKPIYSNWEWFKFISFRIVFPPVILWDLIKFGVNQLAGEFAGRQVVQSLNDDFSEYEITNEEKLLAILNLLRGRGKPQLEALDSDYTYEKHAIITHDNARLDTLEIRPKNQEQDPKYQKYIINLVGNASCYESIVDDMQRDAKELQANVIGFNYRGVGASTGKPKSKYDLVTDGIAQVQRLLDQGVSPENIILKGHSLGGGVSAMVGAHFHKIGLPINVFNSRSFSTVTNFLIGHIRLEHEEDRNIKMGHTETTGGKILGWILKPLIKLVLALAKWDINAGDAFKSIPEKYRSYIVNRSKKDERTERYDDCVIPHYASIHEALTSERKGKKAQLDKEIKKAKKDNDHERVAELEEKRKHLKDDHKMKTDYQQANGHNVAWSDLRNNFGVTGHEFFKAFVETASEDHAVRPEQVHNV